MTAVGDRVRLDEMDDPYSNIAPGALGTVKLVDSLGTVHVVWDDGRRLGLVPGEDVWTEIEHIELGPHRGEWLCVCGNYPSADGFYPCNETTGVEVEPDVGGYWDGVSYVCSRCGRIINQYTGDVTGRRAE